MRYCGHCGVFVRDARERCVLCGITLPPSEAERAEEAVFPSIAPAYERHLAVRILAFLSFSAVVASFTIRLIVPTRVNWPLLVLFGILSMWASLIIILRKRRSIPKTILWQVAAASLLSVFWDWQTGWRGWSLDYLIPILSVTAVVVMYVTARILKLSSRDYITYALLDCLLGIVPAGFLALGWVKRAYPTILCVAVNIIFLAAIMIFEGGNIRREMNRKMHI